MQPFATLAAVAAVAAIEMATAAVAAVAVAAEAVTSWKMQIYIHEYTRVNSRICTCEFMNMHVCIR